MIQKTIRSLSSILLLATLLVGNLNAQNFNPGGLGDLLPGGNGSDDPVTLTATFRLLPDSNQGYVYVEATIEPSWHLYSMTQPSGPMKSELLVEDTTDYKMVGPWKADREFHVKYDEIFEVDVESYEGGVIWSAPIEFTGTPEEAAQIDVVMQYEGQTCVDNGSCIPLSESLTASFDSEPETREIVRGEITTADAEPVEKKQVVETPEELAALAELYHPETAINYEKLDGSSGKGTFLAALIGAFLGGMILNLMPCVFPVLGIKLMGFVEQAGNEPGKIRKHGLAFAAGLIFSMWVLAGTILTIKLGLEKEIQWGEQMANSYFVGAIVIMLFVLGLNMAGVFELGMFMTRAGAGGHKSGYMGSFVSGIITTLVATPCSGPFLGTAMSYTLVQPWYIAIFLFTIFGLGISFPYVLLSFFPKYINMLPKPGPWMETFKKFMAFTLFAAAAFFARAFGTQTGIDGISWFLMALCVIALALFFYGKWGDAFTPKRSRLIWGWAAPVVIGGLGFWMYLDAANLKAPKTVAENDHWQLWVPGRVESKLAQGKPVWVDYTADW